MFLMALALSAVLPPPRPMSVEVIRDPITDNIRAYATLREAGNRLVVSCEPSKYDGPRITFHGRHWLARGNLFTAERPVIYRFDDQPPRRMMWDVRDRRGRLSDRGHVRSFLAGLTTARKLVIRTRDIEQHRFDLTFRLSAVRPAVEQALGACAQGVPQASSDEPN